ncbi:MAG: hypothetical protein ACK4HW_04860 [Roseinatronobacter sp.]
MQPLEVSPIPDSALPVDALREHLRLSFGFADAVTQDALLIQYLRAALAQVEARTGRALYARAFVLRLNRWRHDYAQPLLVAPVSSLTSVTLRDAAGMETVLPAQSYRLEADTSRPRLVAAGMSLPMIPTGGGAVIQMTAGFGPDWTDIPADLRQAVLLLAAQFYEARDTGLAKDTDFGVRALLERWRDIRLGGGQA